VLSKTRFQYGVTCRKRLWLDLHRRELGKPPDAAMRLRLAEGHRVGRLARELWPRGVLVGETSAHHARAVARTRLLLDDDRVNAIFEAAFEHDGLRVRADILERSEGGFALIEVKSSLEPRPEHLLDLAVQAYVIDGSGVDLTGASLMHLDRDYEWTGGGLDRQRLFRRVDLTAPVLSEIPRIRAQTAELRAVASAEAAPNVAMGLQCVRPYECPFLGFCRREAGGTVTDAWVPRGDARSRLAAWPVSALDVQTFSTALPRFVGTRPHERIPFAWSLRVHGADGATKDSSHFGQAVDPREGFAAGLAAALPEAGPIVFFSDAAPRALATLASRGDAAAADCARRLSERGIDLVGALGLAGTDSERAVGTEASWEVLAAGVDPAGERPTFASRREASAAYVATLDGSLTDARRRAVNGAIVAYGRWSAKRLGLLVARARSGADGTLRASSIGSK
jgi:hypothetical protein